MARSADSSDNEELDARIRALEATVDRLIEILVGREHLTAGHRRLLAKVAERSALPEPPVVKLRVFSGDKYEIAGPDIDCASLVHLCRARCCSLDVKLTRQDIDEGQLEWQVEQPYLLTKASDGYCSYLGEGGGCGVYDVRPATCREYDCRDDRRIWTDFEARIPAPYGLVRDFE